MLHDYSLLIALFVLFNHSLMLTNRGPQNNLVRYLRETTASSEHDLLRQKPVFSGRTRNHKDVHLYKLNQLYEPVDALSKLGLPVLYWDGIWTGTDNDGSYLYLRLPCTSDTVQPIFYAHWEFDRVLPTGRT